MLNMDKQYQMKQLLKAVTQTQCIMHTNNKQRTSTTASNRVKRGTNEPAITHLQLKAILSEAKALQIITYFD
jgi:hypothetical protein